MMIQTDIAHGTKILVSDISADSHVEGKPGFGLMIIRESGVSLAENMTRDQAADLLASLLSMGVTLNDSAKRSLRIAEEETS